MNFRRDRRLVPRLAVALLFSVALATSCGSGGTGDVDRAGEATGPELPAIELERLGGGTFDVAATGEARVLNLWATWCTPCRAELPAFDRVAKRLASLDGAPRIVGVNVGETGDDAAALVDELGLTFDQVLDPRAQIQRELRITGMPATILLDADGQVLTVHSGEVTEDELAALLDEFFDLGLS